MNEFIDSFAYWLADFYMLSAILLAAALVAMWFTKQPVKRLAVAKSILVAIVLLAVLCALPGWSVIHLLAGPASVAPTIQSPTVSNTSTIEAAIPIPPTVANEHRSVAPLSLPELPHAAHSVSLPTMFGLAQMAGSACVLSWLGVGAFAARRLLRDSQPAPIELSRLFAQIAPAHSRGFDLLMSDRIDVAVAIGVTRPCVVLPHRWADDRSAEELQTVLAHEVAHVQNGDLAWLALGRLLLVLLWAQPLYWLLRRTLRLDQEVLADAAAAEHAGRRQYAEQLVAWARDVAARPRLLLPVAMGLWEGPSQLRRRVTMLLDERLTMLRRCPRVWQLSAIALVVALAALLSVATLKPMNIAKAEQSDTATAAETQHTVSGAGTTVTFVAGNPPTPWAYKPNVLAFDVQDVAGKPIEGVEAIVYRWSTHTEERELVKQAITDQRGAVEFAGLVAPERAAEFHELAAKSESPSQLCEVFYTVLRGEGLATVILPASDFQLAGAGMKRRMRMRPAAELSGRVTDSQGKAVAGATVAAGSIAGVFVLDGINAVKTDADGRYRFADRVAFTREAANKRIAERNQWAMAADRDISKLYPAVYDPAEDTGTSDLYVMHPDYAVTTVRGGDVPGETDVVMAPAAAIEGRVVEFGTDKPAAGIRVETVGQPTPTESESPPAADGSGAELFLNSWHSASTRTDGVGNYRLANLPAGKYEVWVEAASEDGGPATRVSRGVAGIVASGGAPPVQAPDMVLGPGGVIRGRLVDATTVKPLEVGDGKLTVTVVTQPVEPSGRQNTPLQTVSVERDGRFEVRTLPGKSRLFMIVNMNQADSDPQGDYRSADDTFESGPVFDLAHGETIDADFKVWPRARIDEKRKRVMRAFNLLNDQEYDKAIVAFTELIADDPKNWSAYSGRGGAYERSGRIVEAAADYEAALKIQPNEFGMMLRLAELLATSPDANVRHGRRAVELATQLLETVRQNSLNRDAVSQTLVMLAAAQAEAGDFDAAEATQREAIENAPESRRDEMRDRLKLYEAGKPYRRELPETGK